MKITDLNITEIPSFCINLDDRPDRWQSAVEQFNKFCLNVKKFTAIKIAPGWQGCRQSHLDLLFNCRDLPYFIIYEDDVVFLPNFYSTFTHALFELPDNWEILHLGANLQQPIRKISDHLCELKGAFCTHAMLFNNTDGLVNRILKQADEIRKIDVFYRDKIQTNGRAFITYPMIATQADSYSDITRKDQKYMKLMIENFNKNII
jgi:glycosyl transferase, family 25